MDKLQYEIAFTRAKVEEVRNLAGHFKKGLLLIDEFQEAIDNVLESLKNNQSNNPCGMR